MESGRGRNATRRLQSKSELNISGMMRQRLRVPSAIRLEVVGWLLLRLMISLLVTFRNVRSSISRDEALIGQ